ncbi:MAG: alanine--tRNA ligase [Propionibacteriaceae bacterium]|jgi:alanyl-tRNA synthetase|nr:alanine--tRNA ligase [Propionibacteriaceae bacterium]
MLSAEIRQRFLNYFARHDHAVVPSASLLYNDPTLLFVNAGMVPFKDYFTQVEPAPWRRAVSVQKCVRTLDIDEVGKTTRHGTFFQMNGNFSFGDYFKSEAIEFAWELVTGDQAQGNFGFDPQRVWVTVLGPGHHPTYPDGDIEARQFWMKVGVDPSHIQSRGLKDNYWTMGVPGPGGPCSEIYIDRGPSYGREGGPEADEDRFLEIWNLVFQTEELGQVRAKDDFDVRATLPSRNIDTGMGLERVALLLQDVDNMYEIDQVFPVIERACALSGKRYGQDHDDDVRLRVVADHVRSSLMLMTDGVTPGNEGRGYVLRRLLRRSIRSMRLLGVDAATLVELLSVSRDQMAASYPEITDQWARIADVSTAEESSFRRTLNQGTALFDLAVSAQHDRHSSNLPGEQAFQLHDTFGFPIDLTVEMANEAGLTVDLDVFGRLMQEQKDRAKADARAKKGQLKSTPAYAELRKEGETVFLGYDELIIDSHVIGLIKAGQPQSQAQVGDEVEVVLRETPFYAEAGGQDADQGVLTAAGMRMEVIDVQKPIPGLIVHRGLVTDGAVEIGARVTAAVDSANRFAACQAHTATHIINAGLRQLVGPQTHQAGSYNKPGYLRFDFNASQALSVDMRAELEGVANQAIRADWQVTTNQMPLAEAKALGAQAMFGEKYGEIVRMVEFAGPWSRELCGGTHVSSTAQIGLLSLIGESSVGSGVRRVEALVSAQAFDQFAAERAIVTALSSQLKVQPGQLGERIGRLLDELRAAEKQISQIKTEQMKVVAKQLLSNARPVGQCQLISAIDPLPGGDLRALAQSIRGQLADSAAVVVLVATTPKPTMVLTVSPAGVAAGLKAGALLAAAMPQLGGRGGGGADMAQGGGDNPAGAQAAIDVVAAALQ